MQLAVVNKLSEKCGIFCLLFYFYFQSPILQNTLPIGNHNNIIQVIFLEKEKHWAVISTLNSDKDVVYYYDSVYSSISLITQQVIVNLLKPTGSLTVKIKMCASR